MGTAYLISSYDDDEGKYKPVAVALNVETATEIANSVNRGYKLQELPIWESIPVETTLCEVTFSSSDGATWQPSRSNVVKKWIAPYHVNYSEVYADRVNSLGVWWNIVTARAGSFSAAERLAEAKCTQISSDIQVEQEAEQAEREGPWNN